MNQREDLRHTGLTLIKIGTTTLTTHDGQLDSDQLKNLVDQIGQELIKKRRDIMIVTSGAIACGSIALSLEPLSIPQKQASASVGQSLLMHHYTTLFKTYGCSVGQILLTKDCLQNPIRQLNICNTISTLLHQGAIPIINENDTIATDEIGEKFGDNDELSCKVAQLLHAKEMIILSDIDGVYTANPTTHADAKQLTHLDPLSTEWHSFIQDIPNTKSRGGMLSKLTHAVEAVQSGVSVVIANGRRPRVLTDIFDGNAVGTRIESPKNGSKAG